MPGFRLNVLNPGGRDPDQSFAAGVPSPSRTAHAPVNYHAYAACTGGSFLRSIQAACNDSAPVLLLLRRDLRRSLDALLELKAAGRTVAISFKETGIHQTSHAFATHKGVNLLRRISAASDGFLTPVSWLRPVFESLAPDPSRVLFLPTPYPLDEPGWDFSRPLSQRQGIFVGTREWSVPTRRHGAAVLIAARLAAETHCPLGVFNTDGRRGEKMLRQIASSAGAAISIHNQRLPYPDYLKIVARHRIVFQMDASQVPGQVAGDALLTGTPCIGGNGTIESFAYADTTDNQPTASLLTRARQLLKDDAAWQNAVVTSQTLAKTSLAFRHAADKLETFFHTISHPSSP